MALDNNCSLASTSVLFEVVRDKREQPAELAPRLWDIVFANEDEARAFCEDESPEAALDAFNELCATAAVKLGADGAWLQSVVSVYLQKPNKVETAQWTPPAPATAGQPVSCTVISWGGLWKIAARWQRW